MELIKWTDNLSVEIPSIDAQHKELIKIINELYEAMSQGKGKDILGKTLDRLVTYTKTHFSTEESYFSKFNYPDKDSHIGKHKELVSKAIDLQSKFKSGNLMITIEVMNFLKDWLSNHIQKIDKEYSSFLKDNGVN